MKKGHQNSEHEYWDTELSFYTYFCKAHSWPRGIYLGWIYQKVCVCFLSGTLVHPGIRAWNLKVRMEITAHSLPGKTFNLVLKCYGIRSRHVYRLLSGM